MKDWEESNCWDWPFSTNRDGYGQITIEKKYHQSHKFMYETMIGNVPHGTELDHLCRNKKCVNPFHLEPVSHAENCRRGSNTKLNQVIVDKIKAKAGKVSQREIAEEFGISRAYVGLIIQGKRWS